MVYFVINKKIIYLLKIMDFVDNSNEDILSQLKKMEKDNFFSKSDVKDIHLHFFYVINKKLEYYNCIDKPLENNILSKDQLNYIILKNKKHEGKQFTLTGLYKYHFTENVKDFIISDSLSENIQSYSTISDIKFDENIEFLQDYSSIIVILESKPTKTRKNPVSILKNKTIKH